MVFPATRSSRAPLTRTHPLLFRPSLVVTPNRSETPLTSMDLSEEAIRLSCPFSPSEDFQDAPDVGENTLVAGVEVFNSFERRINNLDKELRNFANATHQLGSSVAILSSAFRLRERLAQILFLFRQNAADLFPKKIFHNTTDIGDDEFPKRKRRAKPKAPAHSTRPVVTGSLDPEVFPEQLAAFASDISIFLHCLNEFPEFIDEAVNASICSFEGDLKYWASCLRVYTGCFRYASVQRYIHDLSSEMGEHMDSITTTLSMFIEIGVPAIRFAQEHGANNLLNLSTVATLFSGVTATTMQFSFNANSNKLSSTVNTFWFSSLVFSIAAAVNSLLGVTWRQAMYRSPAHRVPWWVLIWIKKSPLVFLVMSVTSFSLGLCCFAYASSQARLTSTLTTVFTAFTSFGLVAVAAWFASERYIFSVYRGQKWLSDVLLEYRDRVMNSRLLNLLMTLIGRVLRRVEKQMSRISAFLRRVSSKCIKPSGPGIDSEAVLPTVHMTNHLPPIVIPSSPISSTFSPVVVLEEGATSPTSRGKELWKNAYRSVKRHTAISSPNGISTVVQAVHKHTHSSSDGTLGHDDESARLGIPETPSAMSRSRIRRIRSLLNDMEVAHELVGHSGLVRHLEFSPDGKYLATASWDRTSAIFHVEDHFVSHRILVHSQGFVGQVAWSPDGRLLLTKLPRQMKIWTVEDGVCQRTIDRKTSIEFTAWLPDGSAFISVEGNHVARLSLSGKELEKYDFGSLKLRGVAVTPDSARLIIAGQLTESPTGLKPRKSRPEKQLIVYNMSNRQLESQTPVLDDIQDISVVRNARNNTIALISYGKVPTQLWELQSVRNQESTRLVFRKTYFPKTCSISAGPSYFGGKCNEFVLCAGKAGDIHIWDQESGGLLHHIQPQQASLNVACLAWNRAQDNPFMFAVGTYDGVVRIWTKPKGTEDDSLENFDLGHHIPRTQSPFEIDPQELCQGPLRSQRHRDSYQSQFSLQLRRE